MLRWRKSQVPYEDNPHGGHTLYKKQTSSDSA